MARTKAPWSEEAIATLKRLRADGHSASVIARTLGPGFTRNSVVAKAYRLNLPVLRAPTRGRSREGRQVLGPSAPGAAKPKSKKATGSLVGHRPNVIKGVQGVQPSDKAVPIEKSVSTRLQAASQANADALWVRIDELNAHECKWPVNDAKPGETHRFCGAPSKDGSVYCAAHHNVAYNAAPRRPRKTGADAIKAALDRMERARRPTLRAL